MKANFNHLLQKAIEAHNGVSMYPEKRGESTIKEFEHYLNSDIEELTKAAEKYEINPVDAIARYSEKFERLFLEWINAKSNCISSFITGGSNFPVRRAEKYNNREHAKYEFLQSWRQRVVKAIIKGWKPKVSELEDATKNLENRKAAHEKMKKANAIIRKHKGSENAIPDLVKIGFTEIQAKGILTPNTWGGKGFETFYLTNNLQNIKRLEDRVKLLQAKQMIAESDNSKKEYEINGVKVCENYEADRLQILFEAKPDPGMISKLKSNGFRWSPFNKAWQRKLTGNAKYSLKFVLAA